MLDAVENSSQLLRRLCTFHSLHEPRPTPPHFRCKILKRGGLCGGGKQRQGKNAKDAKVYAKDAERTAFLETCGPEWAGISCGGWALRRGGRDPDPQVGKRDALSCAGGLCVGLSALCHRCALHLGVPHPAGRCARRGPRFGPGCYMARLWRLVTWPVAAVRRLRLGLWGLLPVLWVGRGGRSGCRVGGRLLRGRTLLGLRLGIGGSSR